MSEKTVPAFTDIKAAPTLTHDKEDPGFVPVQQFLRRFGYLSDRTVHEGRLDEATAEGLARFQEFFGLPVTGEFDEATRARMTTHRCGMPDLAGGVAFVTNCAWPHPSPTFAFEDGTNDVGGTAEFDAVRRACATWAAAAPVAFVETSTGQSPDVVFDWRAAADPDHSMVGGVLAHADFPPACWFVTNSFPKPVHFDDSEHQWVVGAAAGGFDVETIALHELGHVLGLSHSNVAGSVMFPSVSANSTNRALTADDIAGIRALYPSGVLPGGTYTVKQKVNGRFLDAHEIADKDFRLVTRTSQDNDTQRWMLTATGAAHTLKQKSSGRFVDAYEESGNDFAVVTRPAQNNDSQKWILFQVGAVYTIQQESNDRYVDAYEEEGNDFAVVTRTAQNNDSQKWVIMPAPGGYTIQHLVNRQFVDAYEESGHDFGVVTRTAQSNDSQRWLIEPV